MVCQPTETSADLTRANSGRISPPRRKMACALVALRERKILDVILLHLVGDGMGLKITANGETPSAVIFVSRPSETLRTVLNFARVVNTRIMKDLFDLVIVNEYRDENTDINRNHNKRLSEWYQDYNSTGPLTGLPEEILNNILNFLTVRPYLMNLNERASLSVESFSSTAAPLPEDSIQMRQFRLVCHKFAILGLKRLLPRVRIRFSYEGFNTLREIAMSEKYRGIVKQFSYMIPRFYPSSKRQCVHRTLIISANVFLRRWAKSRTQVRTGPNECRRLKTAACSQSTGDTGPS
jgi:hypothetical protein